MTQEGEFNREHCSNHTEDGYHYNHLENVLVYFNSDIDKYLKAVDLQNKKHEANKSKKWYSKFLFLRSPININNKKCAAEINTMLDNYLTKEADNTLSVLSKLRLYETPSKLSTPRRCIPQVSCFNQLNAISV